MRPLSRYELRGELGRGASGVVYEAYDLRTSSLVALKTIEASVAESLYRLKREFRALADVQHPNLVRFGELASDGGQLFFTMEIVRGATFIAHVRPGASIAGLDPGDSEVVTLQPPSGDVPSSIISVEQPGTLDEARLRAALPQLVSALGALHDAGHLHRDVKPSNVLVAEDGRVVLLDFGLVTALRTTQDALDGDLEGTPAFMAPEQIDGSAVGPPADWYALGVMLFVALTGTLPFEGNVHGILEAKLTHASPRVRDRAPSAPADLADLCDALLDVNPAQRPKIREIRARLGMRADDLSSGHLRSADSANVFVGREAELEALGRAFDEVAERRRAELVVVEGEPGVGKSAVVHRFTTSLGARATILEGRCYEQETVPFKGIDAILDALSEHLVGLPESEARAIIAG